MGGYSLPASDTADLPGPGADTGGGSAHHEVDLCVGHDARPVPGGGAKAVRIPGARALADGGGHPDWVCASSLVARPRLFDLWDPPLTSVSVHRARWGGGLPEFTTPSQYSFCLHRLPPEWGLTLRSFGFLRSSLGSKALSAASQDVLRQVRHQPLHQHHLQRPLRHQAAQPRIRAQGRFPAPIG